MLINLRLIGKLGNLQAVEIDEIEAALTKEAHEGLGWLWKMYCKLRRFSLYLRPLPVCYFQTVFFVIFALDL